MKTLRILVVVLIAILLGICAYKFISFEQKSPTKLRCGVITFKGDKDQVHKHSSNTEFILVVLYSDTNKKEDEIVSAATWSSYKVGDNICFNVPLLQSPWVVIFGVIGCFVYAVSIILFLIAHIIWFFTGESPYEK